ncbi:hypothetical protein [Bacillus albus]|uniref:hypothetical protein n=1 Tax=Bacillus cereus group TaxID=86661 RepID=UPI001C120F8D|nr:hypothetical protein [Bacillus albus]MBU5220455.1 hypothetical protein [Bacillus albus]
MRKTYYLLLSFILFVSLFINDKAFADTQQNNQYSNILIDTSGNPVLTGKRYNIKVFTSKDNYETEYRLIDAPWTDRWDWLTFFKPNMYSPKYDNRLHVKGKKDGSVVFTNDKIAFEYKYPYFGIDNYDDYQYKYWNLQKPSFWYPNGGIYLGKKLQYNNISNIQPNGMFEYKMDSLPINANIGNLLYLTAKKSSTTYKVRFQLEAY